jgi:hypothetical protein
VPKSLRHHPDCNNSTIRLKTIRFFEACGMLYIWMLVFFTQLKILCGDLRSMFCLTAGFPDPLLRYERLDLFGCASCHPPGLGYFIMVTASAPCIASTCQIYN